MWLTKSSLFPVTVKPRFPKKSRKAVTFHFFFFFFFFFLNSSQYALHPWFNFLLLFGLTIASKCERSLPLRHDWTSAPGKLPFWPERDVIGHDLVSYPTWRRLSANSGIVRKNAHKTQLYYRLDIIYSKPCMWCFHFLPPGALQVLGHLSLFHRGISLLNWYRMIGIGDFLYRFIQIKSMNMFYMYLQSGLSRHFHWTIIAVLIQNASVSMSVNMKHVPKL